MSSDPTIGDSKIKAEGSGTGEFSATATQLEEGNTYYIRAYATNSKSTVYGEEIEMDYTAVMPVVKTVSVVSKNIAEGVATFKGEVVSLGDLACTERGFVYSTTNTPTIDNNKITASGTGTGTFTATASQLQEGKTYYIRAFVTNKKGTVYGEELTMDYTAGMPEVKTLEVTNKNIGAGTATFNLTAVNFPATAQFAIAGSGLAAGAWACPPPAEHIMTNLGEGQYTLTLDVPAEFQYKYLVDLYGDGSWQWVSFANYNMPLSLVTNDTERYDAWSINSKKDIISSENNENTITYAVTGINGYAFTSNPSITSITISDGVEYIGICLLYTSPSPRD